MLLNLRKISEYVHLHKNSRKQKFPQKNIDLDDVIIKSPDFTLKSDLTLRAESSKSELAKISESRNKLIKNSKHMLVLIKLFCF